MWKIIIVIISLLSPLANAAENSEYYFDLPFVEKSPQAINWNLSTMFVSSFYSYMGLGAGYSKELKPYLSWNVIQAKVYYSRSLGIESKLRSEKSVAIETSPALSSQFYSEAIYSPFSFKWVYFNSNVATSDLGLGLGGGISNWTQLGSVPMFNVSLNLNINFSKNQSYSIVLNNLFYSNANLEPDLEMSFGSKWGFN